MRTIFNTPILSTFFHYLARLIMRLAGWRIDGKLPDLPKYVLIGAPHTSNWDFVLFLGVIFSLRANVNFMGKAELFRFPVGWFFRYCGGVPVDRKKSTGLVDQMVKACNEAENFILVIAPEGTRSKTEALQEGKMGVAFLASKSGFPVLPVAVTGTEDRRVLENLKHFRRSKIIVRAGEPFYIEIPKGKGREQLMREATDEIMCRIAALLPESYRGVYANHPRLKELLKT